MLTGILLYVKFTILCRGPSEKSNKCGGKGSVALFWGSEQLGCVSQDSRPRRSIPHVAPKKQIGKERVHRGEFIQAII